MAYEDEVITALREITGEGPIDRDALEDGDLIGFRQISLTRYANFTEDDLQTRSADQEIAVLYAEGPIVNGDGGSGFGQPRVIAGNEVAQQLRRLRLDDDVKAVVLRVNSPGGSATASEIILRGGSSPEGSGQAGGGIYGQRGGIRRLLDCFPGRSYCGRTHHHYWFHWRL